MSFERACLRPLPLILKRNDTREERNQVAGSETAGEDAPLEKAGHTRNRFYTSRSSGAAGKQMIPKIVEFAKVVSNILKVRKKRSGVVGFV